MAYTAGGTIQAWDYNRLTWGGNSQVYSSAANNLAAIWGTGFGIRGYGQDATVMSVVSAGSTVTATQWSSFVQRLNLCLAHQSGAAAQLASGSNIGIVSGATITAFANANIAVETVTTNANLWTAQGSTTTGTLLWSTFTKADNTVFEQVISRTITFASPDQARYFFNAGGQINWGFNAQQTGVSTTRGTSLITLFNSNMGSGNIGARSSKGITGAGGSINVNNLTRGYWQQTTTVTEIANVYSATASYTSDKSNVMIKTSGLTGSLGDNGAVITILFGFLSPARALNFDATINANVGIRIDIVNPETTYLGSSWGSPTIA